MVAKNNAGGKSQNRPIVRSTLVKQDLLDKLDNFFQKRMKFFFWAGILLTALFTILLFEIKVATGGDDSAYIMRAYDFVKEFKYPAFQGPLYPIVLSPFIALFGINLFVLKFLSAIFITVAAYFFFKAFRNRIPATMLVLSFILISFNYYLLYFGSQTYSEAFFMMLQAIFFYFVLKYFTKEGYVPKTKNYLITGLLLFLMCLTRNVAYASLGALVGFLLLTGKWKQILYSVGSFLAFMIPWEILKRLIWHENTLQFQTQGNMLMYKDFYNPSLGKEDFWGLMQRIIDNSNLYLSKHFFRFLGLRGEEATDIFPLLTVIVTALILIGIILTFRKNRALFFTGIYLGCLLLVSFISLQKHWDQWRLIIVFFPFMLLILYAALYYILKSEQLKNLQFIIPFFTIIILIATFKITANYTKVQQEVLSRNLEGDMLYGFTPDWQNYILLSQWAAKNVPEEYMIACRKPEISFIYTERKFYGISKVPATPVDSIIPDNPDSLVYSLFHIKTMAQSEQRADLKYRKYLMGIVSGEFAFGDTLTDVSNFVAIYGMPSDKLAEMRNDPLIRGKVKEVPEAKTWIKRKLKENTDIAITQPDHLYALLRQSKVKYAILASLRLNPNVNTGDIITTLHRYLYFIQLKYPDALQEVKRIGEDEPSSLIEIKLD